MSVGRFLQQGAAGNAGGAVYVDDVFSTYLYTGNSTSRTITNGIDLDGEGGLVWVKWRSGSNPVGHLLYTTDLGAGNYLSSNSTASLNTGNATQLNAFNSDGFSLGISTEVNYAGDDYASWTFRKQPGFFDVVTWTGDGVAGRAINHSLGLTPGFMIAKRTDATGQWYVWHTSLNTSYGLLNATSAFQTGGAQYVWGNSSTVTQPTSADFTVGTSINDSGATYVAYLFAHDAQDFGTDSDESIIKCGSYTGNGSTTGPVIDLGFEPQWLLVKRTNTSGYDWELFDNMRGIISEANDPVLSANTSAAESSPDGYFNLLPNGFQYRNPAGAGGLNDSGANVVYIAIRRPHKPASEFAATDLFEMDTGANTEPGLVSDFPVDFSFSKEISYSNTWYVGSRLQGQKYMSFASTTTESTRSAITWDYMNGFMDSSFSGEQGWMFRRAPGFFDVVAYTGTGGTGTHTHNLGVVPELMIVKCRSTGSNWPVYAAPLGNTQLIEIDSTDSARTNSIWGNTTPTDSVATIGGAANLSGSTYIAYLFATVPGISKVGSYSGTGATQTIDCGFSSGARFVLLKGTTQNNRSWFVFDTERGITTTAPTSPFLALNRTNTQSLSSIIEPDPTGFKIISTGAGTNGSGEDYIFLAIA